MSKGVSSISRFRAENGTGGIKIEVDLVLKYGYPIPELLKSLKKDIINEIESLTSINIKKILITAKTVVVN
jgi:uncharacterized alkaline shock family protein YloU